jgi:pyridinium-3,5-bisthiocarboxylic acid mononucleotide nickel chelatase
MKTCYFDCYSGISGDMTVGALIDAGADFSAIKESLASLGVPGFTVTAEKIVKKGITATQFSVIEDEKEHHPHRHLHHIEKIINESALPQPVKDAANATFLALGEAEASVHGTTIEKVHFHEVGAVDSIVDIVAAQLGFHLLGIEYFVSSPLHVGAGTVKCAHGIMPVPAPATAKLLQGKPTHGGEVQGELVTPTGAALIGQRVTVFGPAPLMRTEAIGYGSGTKDLPDRANVLRVLIGECDIADSAQETIQVLEANLDDMSGELLAPLVAGLMDGGALDAFLTPVIGKKGRPGHVITVLAKNESAQALCERLFTHSTTLGVRMRTERRNTLAREWKRVTTPWGTVRIKIGSRGEQIYTTSPEYEDCQTVAASANVAVRRVYEAALSAAVQGAFDHE